MRIGDNLVSLASFAQRLRLRDISRQCLSRFLSGLLRRGVAVLGGRLSYQVYELLSEEKSPVDPADVQRATQYICRNWYEGLDSNHRGIPLGSLLEYRVAGSDVVLWERVHILLEMLSLCERSWREMPLKAVINFSITPTFREFVLQQVAAQQGARAVHLVPRRGAIRRFRRSQTQRYQRKNYNPFEVSLLNLQPAIEDPVAHVEMQSILFIASLDAYLTPMIRVMEKLGAEQPACVLVPRAARTQWRRFRDIPQTARILFIEDLFDSETARVLHDALERYGQSWDTSKNRLRSRFAIDGVNIWDACEGGIQHIVTGYLPHCAAYVEMAHRLFERVRPRAIIGARLRRAVEGAFFAVARQAGVPSLVLMHGEIAGDQWGTFCAMARFEHVDKVCVWGDYHKLSILSELPDIAEDSIAVTGNPAYDVLEDIWSVPSYVLRSKVGEQLGLDRTYGKWITFTTVPTTTALLFRAIQEAIAAIPDALLLVKLHPGESPRFYLDNMLPNFSHNVVIVEHEGPVDLFEMLRASDIVLTRLSTTALDALAADVPLVIVDVDEALRRRHPDPYALQRYGIPVPKDQAALTETLQLLTQDPQTRQQVLSAANRAREDLLRGLDGKAAQRVIEVIRELERPVDLVPKARSDRIDW